MSLPLKPKIHFFTPCMINQFYPGMARDSVRLLEAAGFEVVVPNVHVCCGQPAFNSGHWNEAGKVARHFLEVFKEAEIIVGSSGSCISMIRHEYQKLGIVLPVNLKVFEITEFLFEHGEHLTFRETRQKIAFHDSCHALRKLGISHQPRSLLLRIPGTEIVELDDNKACCGFGGTFSVKMPHVSVDMALDKVGNIKRTGADKVAAVDAGCLMNIDSTARTNKIDLKIYHVVELLAISLQ